MKTDREFIDGIYEKARRREKLRNHSLELFRHFIPLGAAALLFLALGTGTYGYWRWGLPNHAITDIPESDSSFGIRMLNETGEELPGNCTVRETEDMTAVRSGEVVWPESEKQNGQFVEVTGQVNEVVETENSIRVVILLDRQDAAGVWSGQYVTAVFSEIHPGAREGQWILWKFNPDQIKDGVYVMDDELQYFYLLSGRNEEGMETYRSLTGEMLIRESAG